MDWQTALQTVIQEVTPELADRAVVELDWVEADQMHALNRDYRHIDQATDVLSFPLYSYQELAAARQSPAREPILLGTLVLCEAVVKDHAREEGRGYEDQVVWSLRHGLRHLLGYDHDAAGAIWQPIV